MIIISNWKSYFTHAQATQWLQDYNNELQACLRNADKSSLVILPSFDVLAQAQNVFLNSPIHIGAQDCSPHNPGAYTGEIPAQSLQELGCTFCLVGHSELRLAAQQTDDVIASKVQQLFTHAITPILCVGETQREHENNQQESVITQQMIHVINYLEKNTSTLPLYIAYEPIWAIGTGTIATPKYIQNVLTSIKQATAHLSQNVKLLYGGSVHQNNIASLCSIDHLDGFLIGKASTDFQQLKKIVELVDEIYPR